MKKLNSLFIIFVLLMLTSCMQKQGSSTFKTLDRILDGEITFSYDNATGTTGTVGTTMTIAPTGLQTINSTISNCKIANGGNALPTGFTINPITCVITGTPTARIHPGTYIIEATNSLGTSKTATVTFEAQTYYTLTGTITGLPAGQSITVYNGIDTVVQTNNGYFALSSIIQSSAYTVTIAEGNPNRFTCSVANGVGTAEANVSDINITCVQTGTRVLSGSLQGITASTNVSLLTNGSTINLTSNGNFSFPPMAYGTSYIVSVTAATGGQTCVVASGSGTLSDDISTVSVICQVLAANTFTLVGSVSGLDVNQSLIIHNGSDSVSATSNGSFVLPSIVSGTTYTITTTPSSPSTFSCSVSNGTGTISSNVTNISIACFPSGNRTLSGTIAGLGIGGLITISTNGNQLTNLTNGAFNFTIPYNSSYNIAFDSTPAGYACAVTNGTGTLTANINNVSITCGVLGPYPINITISGISAGTITLSQGVDVLNNSPNGSYTFATQKYYGDSYSVVTTATPSTHSCSGTNLSGTVTGITNVTIVCTPQTFNLGGTYQGLYPGESITVENNTSSETYTGVTSGVSTGFTFSAGFNYNQSYIVRLTAQPANRICKITAGATGTIIANNSSINIVCTARSAGDCDLSMSSWTARGIITGLYCDGTYMYAAGNFTGFSPYSTNLAVINNTDVHPIPNTHLPSLIAAVATTYKRVIIPDGEGGWYVGGQKYLTGGIKHLKSDFSIDVNFTPSGYTDVTNLKIIGNYLYVSQATTAPLFSRINRFTGVADGGFVPAITGQVQDFVSDGTNLFLVGTIATASGVTVNGVAKINQTTGALDNSFILKLTSDAAQAVPMVAYNIKLLNNQLYIGGSFSYVNGSNTYAMLFRSSLTGVVDTTFLPQVNNTVYGIEIYNNKLIIGGIFTSVLSVTKKGLAFIDVSGTAALTSEFGENVSIGQFSLLHLNETTGKLYLGIVSTATINGTVRNYYAVYDLVNKILDSQYLDSNYTISSIATYQDKVFLGGGFQYIYSQPQSYFARLKISDGKIDTTFVPSISSYISDLAYDSSSNSLFLAGGFTSPKFYLAKWSLDTNNWDATFNQNSINGAISRINIYNNNVYAIGTFTSPRKYFTVFDKTTGVLDTSFSELSLLYNSTSPSLSDINVNANGVIIGGTFNSIEGSTTESSYLARISLTGGSHTANYFPTNFNGPVTGISNVNNNLFISGSFTAYGGSKSSGAKLNLTNSFATLDTAFTAPASYTAFKNCVLNTTLYYSLNASNTLFSLDQTTGVNTTVAGVFGSPTATYCTGNHVFSTGGAYISQGL